MLAHVRDVLLFAGRIDHDKQVVATVGYHQVVQDAALFVGEHRVALEVDGQVDDIDRHQRFQRFRCAGVRQAHLTHMRDVEQAGLRARMVVLLQHAGRILHRHLVAGEWHDPRAELHVQVVERGARQGLCGGIHGARFL